MWGMFLTLAYRLFRLINSRISLLKNTTGGWQGTIEKQIKSNWQRQPVNKKIRLVSGCLVGTLCLSLLVV